MNNENKTTVGKDKLDAVKWNDIDIVLHRLATAEREGKTSVAYWGMTREELIVRKTVKDDKGVELIVVDKDATMLRVVTMFSGVERLIDDIVVPKINSSLKATQLKAGKDVYSMDEKAGAASDFIEADWGLTSRGGGGLANAFNTLRESNMSLAARLLALGQRIVDPNVSAEDKVKVVMEMNAVNMEIIALNAKKEAAAKK